MAKNEEKKMPQVSVSTLHNGYAITIDDHEYMCFTAEQLVSEVFVRLALGELDYMDKDTISAVLESVARWKDTKEAMMANAELIGTARRAQINKNIAQIGQAKANLKVEKLQQDYKQLLKENAAQRMEIERLEFKLRKFDRILVGGKPTKSTQKSKKS